MVLRLAHQQRLISEPDCSAFLVGWARENAPDTGHGRTEPGVRRHWPAGTQRPANGPTLQTW